MRWIIVALAACLAASGVAAAQQPLGAPVFMYHRIDNDVPPYAKDPIGNQLTLTPAQFAQQMQILRARGMTGITASELVDRLAHHESLAHLAVITVDNGYSDGYTQALPILEKYGDKATFFVIQSTIGTPRHFTWAQIRGLMHAGMEIGCQGTAHLDLSQMTPQEQESQVSHCITTVQRYIGVRPRTYVYPSGRYNDETPAVMKSNGIEAAFTTQYGFAQSLAHPYQMPRIRVNRTGAEDTLENAISGR